MLSAVSNKRSSAGGLSTINRSLVKIDFRVKIDFFLNEKNNKIVLFFKKKKSKTNGALLTMPLSPQAFLREHKKLGFQYSFTVCVCSCRPKLNLQKWLPKWAKSERLLLRFVNLNPILLLLLHFLISFGLCCCSSSLTEFSSLNWMRF